METWRFVGDGGEEKARFRKMVTKFTAIRFSRDLDVT